MIVYDLICAEGHAFEGWFDNADNYDEQAVKGLVTCPVCGTAEVQRALSTFGIARHRGRDSMMEQTQIAEQMYKSFLDNFENVGADFTKEALKMHYGVTEQRNIRGVSTVQEEETLRAEGIEFHKVPVPASLTSDKD